MADGKADDGRGISGGRSGQLLLFNRVEHTACRRLARATSIAGNAAERVLAHRRQHQHDGHRGAAESRWRDAPAAVRRAAGYADRLAIGPRALRRDAHREAAPTRRRSWRRATVDSATSSRPTACCSSSPAVPGRARRSRTSTSSMRSRSAPRTGTSSTSGWSCPRRATAAGVETPRKPWNPCDVPYGEAGWPALEPVGTIRQPGERSVWERLDGVVSATVRRRSVRRRSTARAVARTGARPRRVLRRQLRRAAGRSSGAMV